MLLPDVLTESFRLLERGVSDRDSPFRTLSVATVGLDGAPQVRTVVLRGLDAAARALWFHTDARAPKVAELRRSPAVSVLGWDPAARVQLRLSGRAALHEGDAAAREQWNALHAGARRAYRIAPRSGTVLDDPAEAERNQVTEDQAFGNFCAVRVVIDQVEWLQLDPPEAPGGQRRARVTWLGGVPAAHWLVP